MIKRVDAVRLRRRGFDERKAMVKDLLLDGAGMQEAFDEVFEQAIVFHGFADYMRDYDVFVYTTADPRTGIVPQHLRFRFKHWCLRGGYVRPLVAGLERIARPARCLRPRL
uniref:YxiG-like protein n=1 Tax=Virgisporangium ochraceum TaxID=65505 RepID=UPI001EF39965|nr:hypothetical protein [Virgisporangium ochraceum]